LLTLLGIPVPVEMTGRALLDVSAGESEEESLKIAP